MRFISLVLAALLFAAQPIQAAVHVGWAVSIASKQSLASGAVESFESATFDTTGWTETDSAGVITPSDSTRGLCGSKSMKLVSNSGTSGTSTLINDFGSDADFYAVVHFYKPSVAAWTNAPVLVFSENSDGTNYAAGISFLMSSGDPYLRIYSSVHSPSENFAMSQTAWYRLEIHVVSGGTSKIRLYYFNGSSWVSVLSTNSNQDISCTSGSFSPRYLRFTDDTDTSSDSTFFFDGIKIGLSATNWIGDITCP